MTSVRAKNTLTAAQHETIAHIKNALRHKNIKFQIGFSNFTQNINLPDALVIDIQNSEEMMYVNDVLAHHHLKLKETNGVGLSIRPAAGGNTFPKRYSQSNSLSPLVVGDVLLRLNGAAFSQMNVLDQWVDVQNGDKEQSLRLVEVGPNVKVKQLDEFLYHHHNIVLPTSPYFAWISVAGAIATGANGTGRDYGTFSDNVFGLEIRRFDNTLVKINGETKTLYYPNGNIEFIGHQQYSYYYADYDATVTYNNGYRISQKGKFKIVTPVDKDVFNQIKLENNRLKQEFDAIKANHMGLFGTLEKITLGCIPAQKLACRLIPLTMDEFKKSVRSGLIRNNEYISFSILPDYNPKHDTSRHKRVLVMTWNPVPLSTPNQNHFPKIFNLKESLQVWFSEFAGLPSLLKKYKFLVPLFLDYAVKKVRIPEKEIYIVGDWHDVAHRKFLPNNINTAEFYIPIKEAPTLNKDGGFCYDDEIIQAIEHLDDETRAYALTGHYPQIYEFYGRVIGNKPGSKSLGASFPPDCKYVFALDTPTGNEIENSAQYHIKIQQYFCEIMGAHPHPGKKVYFHDGEKEIDPHRLYGDQINNFNKVAKNWYEQADELYEESPYLNDFLRTLFQLPKLTMSVNEQNEIVDDAKLLTNLTARLIEKEANNLNQPVVQRLLNGLSRLIKGLQRLGALATGQTQSVATVDQKLTLFNEVHATSKSEKSATVIVPQQTTGMTKK